MTPIRIAVMVSGQGRGSNMQAIIDACGAGKINGEVALVVGSKNDAPAMERARAAGAKTATISPNNYDAAPAELDSAAGQPAMMRAKESGVMTLVLPLITWDYEEKILRCLQVICLAGYMRVLERTIVDGFRGRIMNVHPALVPSFCGKGMYGHHVHEAVIARGVKFTGVTVHFVDEDYDTGPIILQSVVPVEPDDTPDTLAARVLIAEHATYTDAIALFARGRLRVVGRKVKILADR